MANPKPTPPTAEQTQRVRDGWTVLLHDTATIAADTGLSRQAVQGLIRRHGEWSRARALRLRQHDDELAEQGAECTRRQMRAALAGAGAVAIAAEKAERFFAAATDEQAVAMAHKLPSLRDLHQVERVNTGRPVAGPPALPAVGDDRTKSILERAIERCRAEGLPGIPTEPFPGEGVERPTGDESKGGL